MSAISIVHLEDSPLDAELIHARLARGGFELEIDRAATREEFIAAVEARPHDLILADYSLPSFDGVSALEIARERVPETPFIFVSGRLGEEVAIETLKSGATDYVLKQRLERLAPAVHRALAESHERAKLKKAEAALREGEVRHRLILDSITDYAVITTDTLGLVRGWSAGAERVFGQTEAEAFGRPLDLIYTPEDIAEGIPEAEMTRARQRGHGDDERWHVRGDGTRFWGSGAIVPLVDERGELRGSTKVVRDMTDRKRAEDALREADRRKDEFLAMLAHELRNPLSAINNAVQLSRRPNLPPDRQEWTKEIIAHQVRHLARMVDDLLDVSRVSRGKIRLRKDWIDLPALIQRAVETTRSFLEERQHTLSVTISPGPARIHADPTRLEQVIVNLLTNAAKYTEPGGQISLTASLDDFGVSIRVKDNGIGMPPEVLARVFDLFAQADDSLDRTTGGLGIGLTVARKLAELHGGTLSATSDGPDLGSEFLLRIPSHASDGVATIPPDGAPGEPKPGPIVARVLVVDDNVDTACSLAELLRSSGHNVSVAHDGAEAVEAARKNQPEVVLLDIGLPVLDGYQVAQTLRRDDGLKNALLIAITGYGGEQAVRRAFDAGFDHHMTKPIDYDRLLSLLLSPRR